MSDSSVFSPVMDPYAPRVVATYLAQAFNGGATEVPPTASPVWPLAVRMLELMRRDRYALGAYHASELTPARPLPVPQAYRSVRITPSAQYSRPVRMGVD